MVLAPELQKHSLLTVFRFLEINPNGRIPALTDTYKDGTQIRLFEGGSILQYLSQEYDPDHKISFPIGLCCELYEAHQAYQN